MKSNHQKFHFINYLSKYIEEKRKNSKKKINNTLISGYNQKNRLTNFQKFFGNKNKQKSKFKTCKNSRTYTHILYNKNYSKKTYRYNRL